MKSLCSVQYWLASRFASNRPKTNSIKIQFIKLHLSHLFHTTNTSFILRVFFLFLPFHLSSCRRTVYFYIAEEKKNNKIKREIKRGRKKLTRNTKNEVKKKQAPYAKYIDIAERLRELNCTFGQ